MTQPEPRSAGMGCGALCSCSQPLSKQSRARPNQASRHGLTTSPDCREGRALLPCPAPQRPESLNLCTLLHTTLRWYATTRYSLRSPSGALEICQNGVDSKLEVIDFELQVIDFELQVVSANLQIVDTKLRIDDSELRFPKFEASRSRFGASNRQFEASDRGVEAARRQFGASNSGTRSSRLTVRSSKSPISSFRSITQTDLPAVPDNPRTASA